MEIAIVNSIVICLVDVNVYKFRKKSLLKPKLTKDSLTISFENICTLPLIVSKYHYIITTTVVLAYKCSLSVTWYENKRNSFSGPWRWCMFIVFLLVSSCWVIISAQSRDLEQFAQHSRWQEHYIRFRHQEMVRVEYFRVETDIHLGWGDLKAKVLHGIWEEGTVSCPAALLFQANSWFVLPALDSNIWSCWRSWRGLPYGYCYARKATLFLSYSHSFCSCPVLMCLTLFTNIHIGE